MNIDMLVKYLISNTYNPFHFSLLGDRPWNKTDNSQKCYIHYTSAQNAAGYIALALAYKWCQNAAQFERRMYSNDRSTKRILEYISLFWGNDCEYFFCVVTLYLANEAIHYICNVFSRAFAKR